MKKVWVVIGEVDEDYDGVITWVVAVHTTKEQAVAHVCAAERAARKLGANPYAKHMVTEFGCYQAKEMPLFETDEWRPEEGPNR